MERTWLDQTYSEIIQGQKGEGVVDAAEHPAQGVYSYALRCIKNSWNLLFSKTPQHPVAIVEDLSDKCVMPYGLIRCQENIQGIRHCDFKEPRLSLHHLPFVWVV